MARPQVWLDLTLPPYALTLLHAEADACGPRTTTSQPDPFVGIEDADAALTSSGLRWNGAVLGRARRLRLLARVGIGYDNVDVAAATAHGIPVANTPDGPTESTAEHTVALILALSKRIYRADRLAQKSGWTRSSELIGMELTGKTLGVVGLGRIGSRVTQIARVLGLRVLAYDPIMPWERAQTVGAILVESLEAVLRQSDVVTLHAPAQADTIGMIGEAQFAQMKRGVYFINCARGALVDESALLAALRSGQVAAAALDVLVQEPAPAGHPLYGLDNVLITPHIGSYTEEGVRKMLVRAIEQTVRGLRGERPTNLVNPETWPRAV
ncbi:MAG: hydroxyacid dehydrogenase [Anaerolineae bacterium]|nr:hydroxyacid dehydrogenase [Anaerolineae bacterium]